MFRPKNTITRPTLQKLLKEFASKAFCVTMDVLTLLALMRSRKIRTERVVAFRLQQWLCERTAMLLYTYIELLHPRGSGECFP